ncbi:MAG: PIN domain-containing protein [Candidatus Bathyarchaeota archaeon]|nr:PIN domain-containing protein [Candidatus Bathyarchaeota archaeon]
MAVFIDTGIFVAFHNTRDKNHKRAVEIIKTIASGQHGAAYTSDYVFHEAVTVTLTRTRRHEVAVRLGEMLLGIGIQPFVVILNVDEGAFRASWHLFTTLTDRGLSFTDCTTLALLKAHDIEYLASFDTDFDGLVPRIN